MYEHCYQNRCRIYFLCGFLLARPLLLKTGPGTCCSVVFLRSIFSKSILVKGERDKRYNSGGSELPSPVRGNKVVVKATHRFNLIFPHIYFNGLMLN